jgi:hypothetical protein
MTAKPELRICWHGAGPFNAAAWWRWPDGSTSEHVWAVRPTRAAAIAAVRQLAEPLRSAPPCAHTRSVRLADA